MPANHLALERSMANLARAQEIRLRRVKIKRMMFSGEITFNEALFQPSMATCRIDKAVGSMPNIGPQKTAAVLRCAKVLPNRRVENLHPNERNAIVRLVGA